MIKNLITLGMDRTDFILLFGHQIGYASVLYYLLLFVTVILYYLFPKKARWFVLLIASGLFYTWLFPELKQAALFGITICLSWICGLLIRRTVTCSIKMQRGVLILSIMVTAWPLLLVDANKMIMSAGQGAGVTSCLERE